MVSLIIRDLNLILDVARVFNKILNTGDILADWHTAHVEAIYQGKGATS